VTIKKKKTIPQKGGRPPVEIDEAKKRLIRGLLSHGETPARVAEMVGVSEPTLRKYCADDIESAFSHTYNRIAMNLAQRAMSDSKDAVPAAIFWLKTRARWRETGDEQKTQPIVYSFSAPLIEGESVEQWLEKRRAEREQ